MFGSGGFRGAGLGVVVLLIGSAGAARAGVETPSDSGFVLERPAVSVDRTREQAHFELDFSRRPDFFTLDEFGRQKHSFQFFVNPDWPGDPQDLRLDLDDLRAVIRGEEIHAGGLLPIRDATPSNDTGPEAGGWGEVIGSVPFELDDDTVRFSVPWQALKDTDGAFSYLVISTEFGGTTSSFTGRSIPLPPAAWGGLATLGGLAVVLGLNRVRRRSLD